LHVLAVIQDLDLASREPTGVPGPALPLTNLFISSLTLR
jgi:hypothetical protein